MSNEFEEKFIKPISYATYPGILAGLSLAGLSMTNTSVASYVKILLLIGTLMFTVCAFFIFFHHVYPARKGLWTLSATSFLAGLTCSVLASVLLVVTL
jgi:lambda repressor-like predicted transcriptional regulator